MAERYSAAYTAVEGAPEGDNLMLTHGGVDLSNSAEVPGSELPKVAEAEEDLMLEKVDASLGDSPLSATNSPTRGRPDRDVSWSNIEYEVGDKYILKDCWGHVPAGQVCAILGPSGAGKSSLLNVLAGRAAPGATIRIEGTVKVAGRRIIPNQFRKNIAYVMQDDALMATATPREAFMFSAALRLPVETPKETIAQLTEKLLEDLGLSECADVVVGGPLIKGLSGGQRKRTSVGVELITDPSILFLDEPTSGLDSYSACNLVKLLKEIAGRNCAILCTIHQPSSEVFDLFDMAIVMKQGRIFYHGAVKEILPHFAALDHVCPPNYNPADFVMTLAQSTEGDESERLFMKLPDFSYQDAKNSSRQDQSQLVIQVETSFLNQLIQLSYREFINITRDPKSILVRFGSTLVLSIIYGCIFLDAGGRNNGIDKNFNAHVGALTMMLILSMFGSAQPTMLQFPFERPMFLREYSTGTYTVVPYLISKLASEIPLLFTQILLQWVIGYFMIDLQGIFIYFVFIGFGLGMVSNSFAMILGAGLSDVKQVTELSSLVFVPQILFAGFFIRIKQIPVWLRWAQYLCSLSYATKLAFLVEFNWTLNSCKDGNAEENCEGLLSGEDSSLWWVGLLMLFMLFFISRWITSLILVNKAQNFN